MIDRINRYYQVPASKEMINHFRNELGFTSDYQLIFDDLREYTGSTQLHADNTGIPIKQYNSMCGLVGQRCILELIRLAEIGLDAERKRTT